MTDDGRAYVSWIADFRSGMESDRSARETRETCEKERRGMPGRRPAFHADGAGEWLER